MYSSSRFFSPLRELVCHMGQQFYLPSDRWRCPHNTSRRSWHSIYRPPRYERSSWPEPDGMNNLLKGGNAIVFALYFIVFDVAWWPTGSMLDLEPDVSGFESRSWHWSHIAISVSRDIDTVTIGRLSQAIPLQVGKNEKRLCTAATTDTFPRFTSL